MADVAVAGFDSLPVEVLVTHIVPYLANADVCRLCKVNSFLRHRLSDERLLYLWPLYSRRYIEDVAFREEVRASLPVHRLVVSAADALRRGERVIVGDIAAFAGVHTADLYAFHDPEVDMAILSGVHTIHMHTTFRSSAPVSAHSVTIARVQPGDSMPVFTGLSRLHIEDVAVADLWVRAQHAVLRESGWRRPPMCLKDISSLVDAKAVDLVDCACVPLSQIAALRGVVKVVLRGSKFTAIPPELAGVHTLDLTSSYALKDVANGRGIHTLVLVACVNVFDVSALASVHSLDLTGGANDREERPEGPIRMRDVSALGGVHRLILSNNYCLKGVESLGRGNYTLELAFTQCDVGDFSHLGAVHTLGISRNDEIRSGTGLGHVHALTIIHCPNFVDASALGGVHTLTIVGGQVTDVSALGTVHTLELRKCPGADVSALSGVHALTLSDINGVITGVASLGGVPCLDLTNVYSHFDDASGLGAGHSVNLSHTAVTDVSFLGRVHTLNLFCCRYVKDVSMLGTVFCLDLSGTGVTDVRGLGSVHTLKLMGTRITDVSPLGRVHTLDLSMCSELVDVSALGGVHELNISQCPRIVDVSALGRVCVLDASRCESIVDWSPLLFSVRKLIA